MSDRGLADEALPWVRPVKEALARRNLVRGFRGQWATRDGIDTLHVYNSVPIKIRPLPALPGTWDVHISWTLRRAPRTGDVVVWQSSVGLNVVGASFARKARVCLVRYDVDNGRPGPGLAPLGRHLNVHQPAPLDDNAHFAIPGEDDEWRVPQVLDILLSPQFLGDLATYL